MEISYEKTEIIIEIKIKVRTGTNYEMMKSEISRARKMEETEYQISHRRIRCYYYWPILVYRQSILVKR